MSESEENDLPDTPWDIRVDELMREGNVTQQVARDFVIFDWLRKGNTGPYTALVVKGHVPCIQIIKYIALIMNPAEGTDIIVPFALVVNSRGRKGRRPDPNIELRDRLLAQNVEHLMETKSYNDALDEVADILGDSLAATLETPLRRLTSAIGQNHSGKESRISVP